MYIAPGGDRPLLFGDIFSSSWLHDAMVNEDAVELAPFNKRGGGRAYEPLAPGGRRRTEFVLTRGGPCRAILVSDDCEIETWLVRKGGSGRLLFAAVDAWPSNEADAERALKSAVFRRHPLPPGDAFDGGVAEFFRLFAVSGKSLLDRSGRIASLTDEGRADLEQRWAAYATRRGPLAATVNGTKLAHVLHAGDDADLWKAILDDGALPAQSAIDAGESVAAALTQAWRVEGEAMGRFADAHEAKRADREAVSELREELRKLAQLATAAANALP